MPAGTTFEDLLAWMKEYVEAIMGGSSTGAVERRHARDIAAAKN